MKKRILLLSVVALSSLASCVQEEEGSSSSSASEAVSIRRAILKARGNVNFSGSVTSIYVEDGDNYDEGDYDFTFASNGFEWRKDFKEITDAERSYDYFFKKNGNGKLAFDRLTIQNEAILEEYKNPRSGQSYDYDAYCKNPFLSIEPEDFTLIEGRYYLSEEKAALFSPVMSLNTTTSFSYYDVEVSSASLSIVNDQFADVVLATKAQKDHSFEEAEFLLDGAFTLYYPAEVEAPLITPKEHKAEHDELKGALSALKEKLSGNNYTINCHDVTDDGEYTSDYKIYVTENTLYTDYAPASQMFTEGYNKGKDGKYHHFRYYNFKTDEHAKGDIAYYSPALNPTTAIKERVDLDPSFDTFAPEFFIKNAKGNFVMSNQDVADAIHTEVAPFIDKLDAYYVGDRVFFNLENDKIASWGFHAEDYIGGYLDTFTYTISDIGTTTLPFSIDLAE